MITIDAQDKTLGRVASAAAKALLGKHKAGFARNTVAEEGVTITNASKIKIIRRKDEGQVLCPLLWISGRAKKGDLCYAHRAPWRAGGNPPRSTRHAAEEPPPGKAHQTARD